MIRAGIAGSGFAAEFHVAGLSACRHLEVEPAAVYSPTGAHRDAFAARYRLAGAASLEELLDQVDVVHVCAPPAAHEEITCAALAAGVHVILEKPFTGCFAAADTPRAEMEAAAVASARCMLSAERASSATLGYAENWVFAPAVQEEGRAHDSNPIRPATVSARVHALTRLPGYRDAGHLRADYEDIEDCGMVELPGAP